MLSDARLEGLDSVYGLLKCDTDDPLLPPAFLNKASALISSFLYDTLRSIRVNLGSERIEPSLILMSGSLCACPVFRENVSPNILTEHIFADDLSVLLSSIISYKEAAPAPASAFSRAGRY